MQAGAKTTHTAGAVARLSGARAAQLRPRQVLSAAAAPRRVARQQLRPVIVSAADAKVAAAAATEELYEVFLDKPLGIKFGRGRDGGVYVLRTDPKLGNTSSAVTPGDKVVKVSASFGSDVWDAMNFGQVIYAIKTRSGQVYLQLRKNYGDMSVLEVEELSEEERRFKAERAGGNYGAGTKEIQARNYQKKQEAEKQRRDLFNAALAKFRKGQIEEALIDFEEVLGMEPKNYLGDNFSRVTDIYRVTQYNIACCYGSLKQVDNGLDALNSALAAGFEDFDKVRKDPNLANLRAEKERFKAVIDKYDEPIINEAAVNAIKNLFSFGKKKDDLL